MSSNTLAARLWDDAAVSEFLGLSKSHLRTMRARKQGPAYVRVAPRTVRYEPAVVRAWIAARTVNGEPDGR